MAVKEIPVNFRVYYKSMKNAYTQMREDAISAKEALIDTTNDIYKDICDNLEVYKKDFKVNLMDYNEFKNNKYIDGKLLKIAKGMFINRKNDYLIVGDLFDLYNYARKKKEINNIDKDIEFYDKILKLSLKEYNEILKVFYTEVHKQMILKGVGYVFEPPIGWTCINRCHLVNPSPHIDYAATKKRKEELIAAGKRIYNKEEEEWCKKNGIEYKAEDCRVYLKNEYCYEVPLIGCSLPNGHKYKLTISDRRGRSVRDKTNDDFIKDCKGDLNAICELDLDLKTKLTLCNSIDKTLYLNFIRNENQKPLNTAKTNRKD